MKKGISFLLVVSLVLSSYCFAFADFKDVPATNAELTNATSLLSKLGIVNGYEDGSFKPEKSTTRAEMAKVMIAALGYGNIASETPVFTDCEKHWAKGYISLANDLGIIEGKGNGIFDPDSNVTYEQATAMLLRTLGYTNESINGGKSSTYNAAEYKAKAVSLGLYSPLEDFGMKAAANRGDIALMLNVNLQQQMVSVGDNGIATMAGSTLLEEHNTNTALISKVAEAKDVDITSSNIDDYGSMVDLAQYVGQNVRAYLDSQGRIVYVQKINHKIENVQEEVVTTPEPTEEPAKTTNKRKKNNNPAPAVVDESHPGVYFITDFSPSEAPDDKIITPASITLFGFDGDAETATETSVSISSDATYTRKTTLGAVSEKAEINDDTVTAWKKSDAGTHAIVNNYVIRNGLLTSMEITELESVDVCQSAIQTSSTPGIRLYSAWQSEEPMFETTTLSAITTSAIGEDAWVRTVQKGGVDDEPERLYDLVIILRDPALYE